MTEKEKITCRACGKPSKKGWEICPYCATPLHPTCAECGKELEAGFNNCPYCGALISLARKQRPIRQENAERVESIAAVIASVLGFLSMILERLLAGARHVLAWIVAKATIIIRWLRSRQWGKMLQFLHGVIDRLIQWAKKVWERLRAMEWGKVRATLQKFTSAVGPATRKTWDWLRVYALKGWQALKTTYKRVHTFLSVKLAGRFGSDKADKAASVIVLGGVIITALVFFLALSSLFGSRKSPGGPLLVSDEDQLQEAALTLTPRPVVSAADQKWLVMVYSDADDEILEEDMLFDLNEMEMVGSSERVHIVAQVDRFDGGYAGDGDWTSARRYYITKDTNLIALGSELVEDLGEVDMGSTDTLVDFITWAVQSYPADRYVLILSNHGAGWPGGWSDYDPVKEDGNWIYLNQLGAALERARQITGIDQFELVGMDACLMSMLEVYTELVPSARYAVASQEVEPALGWAYAHFLGQLNAQPEMSGADLARVIVEGYIDHDLRILDDEARNDMLYSYGINESMSTAEVAREMGMGVTLSAVDLSAVEGVNAALNDLLQAVKGMDQSKVAEARTYAQYFSNVFSEDLPSPYIDLVHFANLLAATSGNVDLGPALENLKNATAQALLAERHGERLPGASGFSIHFPTSDLYWGEFVNFDYYTFTSQRFSEESLWDDFLAFHYAGREFGSGPPDRAARIPAPGAESLSVSQPVVSPQIISAGTSRVNIRAEVSGERVAYIYLVVMRKVQDRFLFYMFDYVLGSTSQEINGVEYPVWERKNGVIPINITTDIVATAVTDGQNVAFAVLEPDTYSTGTQDEIYSAPGFFINSQTGSRISARMFFFNNPSNYQMRNIIGYIASRSTAITFKEILPKKGDQFQFLDTWWVLDAQGQPEDQLRDGNTLTFGDVPFEFGVTPQFVEPGEYYIGIMAEDLDGFRFFNFAPVVLQ